MSARESDNRSIAGRDGAESPESTVYILLSKLHLDPQNPRLPEDIQNTDSQTILTWMVENEVLDELARSMLTNGFFAHEPLIVLPAEADGRHLVVEGNRRLAALQILTGHPDAANADLAFDLGASPASVQLERLQRIPCFVAKDRDEVHTFLGYRHIGGLKTWSPEAKARYIEEEVERARAHSAADPIREVARQVGSTPPAIRAQYLALKVLRAANEEYGIENQFIMRHRFGVWNRLMNSTDVRSFIGLNDARTVDDIDIAVTALDNEKLAEVIGDLTPSESPGKAVLRDSRDVTIYGSILVDKDARESLRQFGDLELAKQMVERTRLPEMLSRIQRSIELITRDIDRYEINNEAEALATGIYSNARTLRDVIRGRLTEDD